MRLAQAFLAEDIVRSPDVAARLRCALGTALFVAQGLDSAREELSRALVGDALSGARRARCLGGLGNAEQAREDYASAVSAYLEAVALARDAGDIGLESGLYNSLGFAYQTAGRLEEAAQAYAASLSKPDHLDRFPLARRLNNVGTLYNDLGRHEVALDYLNRSLQAYESSGGGPRRYRILVNQAIAYRGLDQPSRALEALNEALPLQREEGDRRAEAVSLTNISSVLAALDRFDEALESVDAALEIQDELGIEGDWAAALSTKADILVAQRDFEGARVAAGEGLQLAEELDLLPVQSASLDALADSYEGLDSAGDALDALRRATGLEKRIRPSSLDVHLVALEAIGADLGEASGLVGRLMFSLGLLVAAAILVLLGRHRARLATPSGESARLADSFWTACSHCKSIRDKSGSWRKLEDYLLDDVGVETSHGICPDCLQAHYPQKSARD